MTVTKYALSKAEEDNYCGVVLLDLMVKKNRRWSVFLDGNDAD